MGLLDDLITRLENDETLNSPKKKETTRAEKKSFYVRFRQWFQPYWRPRPKKLKVKPCLEQSEPLTQPTDQKSSTPIKDSNLAIRLMNYPKPLINPWKWSKRPSIGACWSFHNEKYHQLWAHFTPGMGYMRPKRNNTARRKLKAWIYPRQNKPFDRTHCIPIGYHGSENDPRLVIGWDSGQNQNELQQFETKQKARKEEIYWYTSIQRTSTGATWTYKIFNAKNMNLLDSLTLTLTCDFVWHS